jgi:prepilin-type N-terminal cleavage/methylation domain-containing protein/prepilin-type processing-associated H-X9-DG protein
MKSYSPKISRPLLGRRAFTLVEILVVLAIIAILSAVLLPAFWTVRGNARSTSCRSNLAQLGKAVAMYAQDYDGLYPYGIDQQDRYLAGVWSSYPEFEAKLPNLPFVKDVLFPYLKSKQVFVCPADSGYSFDDFYHEPFDARPTSAEKYGSSYFYNTILAVDRERIGAEKFGSNEIVFHDATGNWHGTWVPLRRRYNTLFVDGHVKNITWDQMQNPMN